MTCDVCQSDNASVYFTQIIEGKMQKVNLCESCAQQKGVTDPTGFALADMLKGLGSESSSGSAVSAVGLRCEHCGFTQSDFKKTGRFGCHRCYQVFSDGLDNLLDAMHRNTLHTGKVPANFEASEPFSRSRLDALQADLEASVSAEDYEEAARLRDAISELEDKISGEASEGEGPLREGN